MLTADQRRCWDERGYAIVPAVLSPAQCAATLAQVWAALERTFGARPDDPRTWGSLHEQGFTEVYHTPALWENRVDPRIYAAFREILGEERLWVSIDRVNWKRPAWYLDGGERVDRWKDWQRAQPDVHTDLNYWHPPADHPVQGLVALTDTDADQGGLAVIPGFHRRWREWAAANADKAEPAYKTYVRFKDKALARAELTPIPLRQGDLVIWSSFLPHSTIPNRTDRWRYCQYVTFFPATPQYEGKREMTAAAYQTGQPPQAYAGGLVRSEDFVQATAGDYAPLALDALGRRIVGLDPWE